MEDRRIIDLTVSLCLRLSLAKSDLPTYVALPTTPAG